MEASVISVRLIWFILCHQCDTIMEYLQNTRHQIINLK